MTGLETKTVVNSINRKYLGKHIRYMELRGLSDSRKQNVFIRMRKILNEYIPNKDFQKLSREEAKEFLGKEIDKLYLTKEKELLEKRKEIIENWDKVKNKFFKEAEKLFEHKWPSGEYIANISIFGMFRLKLGTKTFSIPSEDYAGDPPALGHINFVIIHELLHILFEDYYSKHFGDKTLNLMQYRDLLELVNDVVLNLPQIKAITKWVAHPYPGNEKDYKKLKVIYDEYSSMKVFVGKAIEYLAKYKNK